MKHLLCVSAIAGALLIGTSYYNEAPAPEPGMGSRNDRGSDSGPGHSGSSGRDTSQPAGHPSNPIAKCPRACGSEALRGTKKPGRLAPGARGDSMNIGSDTSGAKGADKNSNCCGTNRDTSNKN